MSLLIGILKKRKLLSKVNLFMQHHPEKRLSDKKINEISTMLIELSQEPVNKFELPAKKALHYTIERMYWSQFSNSEVVIEILRMLYGIEGDFSSLLRTADQSVVIHLFLGYFLQHAYKEKALFGGSRLLSQEVYSFAWIHPVQYAVKIPDPCLVLIMVKFGALLPFDITSCCNGYCPLSPHTNRKIILTDVLISILKINPYLSRVENLDLGYKQKMKHQKLIQCCELILSDLPNLNPDWFHHAEIDVSQGGTISFISTFSANVIPAMYEHFFSPLPLKQICRYYIRVMFNRHWNLPAGIYRLPIPTSLQSYLDVK